MNIQEQYMKEINDNLRKKAVPFKIPAEWYNIAHKAMRFASPLSLGLQAKEMEEIFLKLIENKKLNCFEFAIANNNIENRSMRDLAMNHEEYFTTMQLVADFAVQWNDYTAEANAKIFNKYQRKL